MTDEQRNKLAALHNRATKYEAVVVRADGEKRLLAYCGRHSQAGLLEAAQNRGEHVVRFANVGESEQMSWRNGAFLLGNGAAIQWSGRTQRDAISEGELPYIGAS